MGTLFSKKEKSRITEQDKAVMGLKKQRDMLKQYQKRINNNLEKDRELAKRLLKDGKTDRAKLLLRKKKYQEGLIDTAEKQLDQLERLTQDLEFSQVEHRVLEGLKEGNKALERANSVFSTEDIEELMDETREAVDKQREIDELLSGKLTEADEEDVLKELDALIEEGLALPAAGNQVLPVEKEDIVLPAAPDHEPQALGEQLPDVPSEDPAKVASSAKKKERTAVAAS